ncbi:MAG: CoxG family protein [bacterium]
MEFSGEEALDHLTVEEAWMTLADPVAIQQTIPGCKIIVKLENDELDPEEFKRKADEKALNEDPLPKSDKETVQERTLNEGDSYGVYMEVGVAGLNLSIASRIDVLEREFPSMKAHGEGDIGDYTFEMETGIEVEERDGGSLVKWYLEPDISGSLFRWGSKLAQPIFSRVVGRFFNRIETLFQKNRAT